jgi:hypothetical protein
MTTSEYDHTIAFLAGIFPRLATMPAPGRKLFHETFRRAVELRGGAVSDCCYDVDIATSVFSEVIERAFEDFIQE